MVLLTQTDISACREAYATADGDASRLRAMLAAIKQPVNDEQVLDMCSQVAVARPLYAALGEHAASESAAAGPGGVGAAHNAAAAHNDGSASFEVLVRVVEQQVADSTDSEQELVQAFAALGGAADGTGELSTKRLRAVCKVRRARGVSRGRVRPHADRSQQEFGLLGFKSSEVESQETMTYEEFRRLLMS